jgi:hypothetical protein
MCQCRRGTCLICHDDSNKNCFALPKEEKSLKGKPDYANRFSYGDLIANDLGPYPGDYFYIELRRNSVTEKEAQHECIPSDNKSNSTPPTNNVLCGYLKIGNFLSILKRLGEYACVKDFNHCPASSFFAIGPRSSIPSWASNSATYSWVGDHTPLAKQSIWVPAHNPNDQSLLAERDVFVFLTLYKLYQLVLVDTSKLVTGTIPITISK